MNHIIGKMPEKAAEAVKTTEAEATIAPKTETEQEGLKSDRQENGASAEMPQKTESDTAAKSAHAPQKNGTALRIGAFLTAALCLLAGVRAVKNPGDIQGEMLKGVSTLTVKAADTVSGTAKTDAEAGTETNLDMETGTETADDGTTAAIAEASDGTAQTSAADSVSQETTETTASVQKVMTTAAGTETYVPVSKTRTQEELAEAFAHIPLSNEAELSYDTEALSTLVPAFTVTDQNEPLVLIMHTHGSEGYADTDGRSQDTDKNVVAVGEALEEVLLELGIPVLHDERMYDVPSYTRSYNEAYQGIQDTLEQYPSIQIVMDVHRDAYTYDDGSLLRTADTLTYADGETIRTSRVMFLVGTNAGTLEHPTWRSHLAFAMALQTRMEDIVPGITRSVFLRRQRFNEHMTPGSLLVEIGSSGDTLEEAKAAVRVFGKALAEQILAGEV